MSEMQQLAAARAPLPEHVEELRRRAADLARPVKPPRADDVHTAIIFELGGEQYAVVAKAVLQVVALRELTPLPNAPLPLFGLTQWRGDVLTVLDVREMLGVPRRGLPDLGRVIVVDGRDRVFGVLADAVRDVRDIDFDDVKPLPTDDADGGTLLSGITDDGVLVIDSDALRGLGRGG